MAMDSSVSSDIQEVRKVLWGQQIKDDVFHRWSQGFMYSSDEPTALVQGEGGPCAVIAPVQAFILKFIISDPNALQDNLWRHLPTDRADVYLCQALTEILHQSATADDIKPSSAPTSSSKLQLLQQQLSESQSNSSDGNEPNQTNTPMNCPASINSSPYCLVFLNEPLSRRISCESESDSITPPPSIADKRRSEEEIFHRNLRLLRLENISQVESVLREKIEALKGYYGILQFLYSVILTKGVAKLINEMSEANELIDPVHGHGSQSLINLMLTGRGVGYVWDNDQDVGGLKLRGIEQQGEVGFLTLLERLRYCEVGSFLKNPKYPVWVVGSETHLTVLFSTNMNLVSPETQGEIARRVFHTYDPEGNNFIASLLLEDVMRTLGLFADTEYVDIMKRKLDPETLGVILLNDFMDEFFPNEKFGGPDTFTLFHYNGLPRSSSTRKVKYQEGNAILLESDLRCLSDDNMILTCMQTKWPNVDVQWINGFVPSIN